MKFPKILSRNHNAVSEFEELLLKGDDVILGQQSLPDTIYGQTGRQDWQLLSNAVASFSMIFILALAIYVFSVGNLLPGSKVSHKIKPHGPRHGWLEKTLNSPFMTVVLTPKAVERLGIRTAKVIEERRGRTLGVSGDVVEINGNLVLRVNVSGKADRPTPGSVALVSPQSGLKLDKPVRLQPIKAGQQSASIGQHVDYSLVGLLQQLQPGSRIWLTIAVGNGKKMHKYIPYASVIYDARGRTWTYTSPQKNRFLRAPIEIEFIDGDTAVLRAGPPQGTVVATDGTLELYGAEHKIGL